MTSPALTAPFYDWMSSRVRGPLVLDVGCGPGYLASLRPDLQWTGIELDARRAAQAERHFASVVIGPAQSPETIAKLDGPFDSVVFCDVLEHFEDPKALLELYRPLLATAGVVVAAIPNIAHLDARRALVRGRWQYAEGGIFDRTHLRFFTISSAVELLRSAGLEVVEVGFSPLIPRILRPFGRWVPPSLASTHLLATCRQR